MKKKALFWSSALLLSTWAMSGQTTYSMSLVVESSNSEVKEVVELAKIAQITFSEGKMTIVPKDESVHLSKNGVFALTEVVQCTFSKEFAPTNLVELLPQSNLITWRDTPDALYLEGLDRDRSYCVTVYASSGATMTSHATYYLGTPISTSSWAPGVYLILIDNQTIKYIKK